MCTNRPIVYHVCELLASDGGGVVLKDEQEWMWKDATMANFEPLKEYGKYVPFAVSFQTPSIRLMPEYVHFVEFSQPISSISLNDAHWRRVPWRTNWRCAYNFWWISISKYDQLKNKPFFSRTTIYYPLQKGKSVQDRPEVPRGFQEVKAPRLRDNGTGWW